MYEKRNRQEKQGQLHILCIDDLVPENHMLRDIDKDIDFSFIYDEVEGMYSNFDGGRPGIDPVSLFKIVLIKSKNFKRGDFRSNKAKTEVILDGLPSILTPFGRKFTS